MTIAYSAITPSSEQLSLSVDLPSEEESKPAAVVLPSEEESKPTAVIVDSAYLKNGALVAFCNASQAIVNRLMGNNNLSSGSKDDHFTSAMDVSFTHLNNKLVKGNWSEVDSQGKQLLALMAYTANAAFSDVAASLIPTKGKQASPIGKTTAFATVNAITYLSAMAAGKILGKKTFAKGVGAKSKVAPSLAQKAASLGLVAMASAGTAVANRLFIDAKSSFGTVLNLVANEVVNKLFKTGQGSEKELNKKIKLLAAYCLASICADLLVGLSLPSPLSLRDPTRYLSPTSAGALASFAKVSLKATLDNDKPSKKVASVVEMAPIQAPVAKENSPTIETVQNSEQQSLAPSDSPTSSKDEGKKPFSRCRVLSALVVSLATPILMIASNHLSVVKDSSTLTFSAKLIQHNVNALAVRELFKCAKGSTQRLAVSLIPPVLALGSELVANQLDPSGPLLLPVTGVAVAIASSYLGMTIAGKIFGKAEVDDD